MLCLMVSAFSAYAGGGDRVGNGGDVLVCGDSVELLDIYEARTKGYKFKQLKEDTPLKMLQELLNTNLEKLQTIRTAKLLKYASTFYQEAKMLPNIHLNDVNDSGLVAIPRGCKLEQIVVQLAEYDIMPDGQRYTVNLDLWNKLNSFNQMALILHESIYREAIESRMNSSMVVRAMVGQILKNKIDYDIFLNLSKSFPAQYHMHSEVEYFDGVIIIYGGKNFTLVTDQTGIKQLKLKGSGQYYFSHEDFKNDKMEKSVKADEFNFDYNTGELLSTYADSQEAGRIVEDEFFQITDDIWLKPNQPIFINKGKTGLLRINKNAPLNMTVKLVRSNSTQERHFELNDITEFSWKISWESSWKTSILSGNFNYTDEQFSLEASSEGTNKLQINLETLQIGFDSHTPRLITNRLGAFMCRSYHLYTDGDFNLNDCLQIEETFNLRISNQISIPVSLIKLSEYNRISNSGKIINGDLDFYVSKKVFIGTKGRFKKEVYLEPGNYILDEYGYLKGKQVYYNISEDDGSIRVVNQ